MDNLLAGQAALASGDFDGSAEAFADAGELVQQARGELDTALASSRRISEIVDVTGTLRSGSNLLQAVESLAIAGQHVSLGVAPLLEEKSLTEAIATSAVEFEIAASHLEQVEDNLAGVRVGTLPNEVRADFVTLETIIPKARGLLEQFITQADALQYVLGAQRDRQYLVLLANNDELRPNGGFIGTVALVDIDSGQVESIDVSSVYEGDGQLRQFIAPPDQLQPITSRWYLRDSNWFVDFEVSAKKAIDFFEKEGGPTVDGVMLLTPDVIQRLLLVTGPVEVPGFDRVVTAENFVEITQEEVTFSYDKELNKPKQFLAELTPILLDRIFNETDGKLQAVGALTQSLGRKEMLMYMRNDDIQERLREVGWTGSITRDVDGFLHINNANIGGHKSDQFIDQEVDYRIQVLPTGDAEVVVTTRRTHTGPLATGDIEYPQGEDPTIKDNVIWQRMLVPQGAELLEAKGFTPQTSVQVFVEPTNLDLEGDPDIAAWQATQRQHATRTIIGKEAGYTFFSNWIITEPGQTSVTLYRYKIPGYVEMPSGLDYIESISVGIVKQSGARDTALRIEFVLPPGFKVVQAVPTQGVTYGDGSTATYRGLLNMDKSVGIVFEKGS